MIYERMSQRSRHALIVHNDSDTYWCKMEAERTSSVALHRTASPSTTNPTQHEFKKKKMHKKIMKWIITRIMTTPFSQTRERTPRGTQTQREALLMDRKESRLSASTHDKMSSYYWVVYVKHHFYLKYLLQSKDAWFCFSLARGNNGGETTLSLFDVWCVCVGGGPRQSHLGGQTLNLHILNYTLIHCFNHCSS